MLTPSYKHTHTTCLWLQQEQQLRKNPHRFSLAFTKSTNRCLTQSSSASDARALHHQVCQSCACVSDVHAYAYKRNAWRRRKYGKVQSQELNENTPILLFVGASECAIGVLWFVCVFACVCAYVRVCATDVDGGGNGSAPPTQR